MTKINKSLPKQALFIVTLIIASGAAQASEYADGPDCHLVKFADKKWQPASANEIAGQMLDVVTAKNSPGRSNTKVNGTWYSAKSSCFTNGGEPIPPPNEHHKAGALQVSQFQHQADHGVLEITPAISYQSASITYKATAATPSIQSTTSGIGFSALGEYGLSENFSLGLTLAYESLKTTTTPASTTEPKISGMTDPELKFNGRFQAGPGIFHVGANFAIGLSHATVAANGDKNAASGGMTATPEIGYELPLGSGTFGAQISDDLYKGDSTTETTTSTAVVTTKTSGGQALTATLFYEFNLNPNIFGISASYMNTSTTKTISTTTTDNQDGFNVMGGSLYGAFSLTDTIILLPKVEYGIVKMSTAATADLIDSSNVLTASVGARFKF